MREVPKDIGTVHFVGIGGIGMSGIAEVMSDLGYSVQGSDMAEGSTVKRLRSIGIPVSIGHEPENVANASVVVTSTAVKRDNPEVKAALDARIEQLVGAILQGAPQASVACKDLARTVHTMTLPDAFEKTSALIAQLRSSEEGQEGMMAFLSRRKAAWVPQTPGDDA